MAARKKSKSKRRGKRSWSIPWPAWPGSKVVATSLAWTAFIGALITGWVMGVPRLQQRVAEEQSASEVEIRFVDAPAWMDAQLENQLVRAAAAPLSGNPLAQAELAASRRALLETGWFTQVNQVRRRQTDVIEIDATFFEPFAVIRDGDGDHVVSPEGQLLPRTAPRGHASQFRVIQAAHLHRPRRPGAVWPGDDVAAALELSRLIDARPWRDQVKAISLSRFQEDRTLQLITDRGYRIHWGGPPGEESAGEVSTERKLYYLDYPYEHFGHIDSGYEGNLDITDPRGVFGR